MKLNKKKVLLLSTHDSHLQGHAWSCLRIYNKDRYEVGLVSLYSLYNDKTYAIIPNFNLYRFLNKLLLVIDKFFIKKCAKYSYAQVLSFPITAKQILRKYALGTPDIIVLHWYDGFITPKILKRLYDLTSAKIVFVFTDEFSLGGGCHYPCECLGYETSCCNCPALLNFKFIAHRKLRNKLRNLQLVPKYIIAPTAGLLKAKSSSFFKTNTTFIREFRGFELSNIPVFHESRKNLNISDNDFVMMFGALNVNEERKGFKYILEALEIFSRRIHKKVIVLIVGEISGIIPSYSNIEYKLLGTLSFEKLCEAYVASNVYISPTIADSGPMMLKFAIACGTPVVAFPVGYALDFIVHHKTGYLVDKMSSEELAKGMLYFYKNSDERESFTENCKRLNNEALSYPSVYNTL